MNKQQHLEETLNLLEDNNYPNILGRIMLIDTLEILTDYSYSDFEKQMNRYLRLEVKYK